MINRSRRLLLIVLAGGMLLGSGLFYRHYWLQHPIGAGPAGPVVDRSQFESHWTTGSVLLVGLGDSVTDGF